MAPKDNMNNSRKQQQATANKQQQDHAGDHGSSHQQPNDHHHDHHHEDHMSDLSAVPARVHSVTFSGLSDRTRDDWLIRIAQDILLGDKNRTGRPAVRSFDQLVRRSNELKHQLMHGVNGCFRSVTVTIDAAAPSGHDHDHDNKDGYTVNVSVREASGVTGSVVTTTSAHNLTMTSVPSIESSVRLNNVGGRAESLSLSYSMGASSGISGGTTRTGDSSGGGGGGDGSGSRGFTVTACKPLIARPHLLPSPLIGQQRRDDADDADDDDVSDREGDDRANEEDDSLGSSSTPPLYPLLTAAAFDSSSAFPLSAFRQRERGFLVDYFSHWTSRLTSRTTLQSDWRDLLVSTSPELSGGLDESVVPQEIRDAACGRFTRTGLKHVLAFDGRSYWLPALGARSNSNSSNSCNYSHFPSSGVLAELSSHVCSGLNIRGRTLIPGNQAFVKQEAHVQLNERIPGTRVLLQACFRAGILLPFTSLHLPPSIQSLQPPGGRGVSISDKFFVGGAMTMRGFSCFGIGPSVSVPGSGSNDGGGGGGEGGSRLDPTSTGVQELMPTSRCHSLVIVEDRGDRTRRPSLASWTSAFACTSLRTPLLPPHSLHQVQDQDQEDCFRTLGQRLAEAETAWSGHRAERELWWPQVLP